MILQCQLFLSLSLSKKKKKNRHIEQWNRIGSPEINPQFCGQLIYDKRDKTIQWGKDSLFNKQCLKNWTAISKRIKLDHFLTAYTKINSNGFKDLNVRPEFIKLLKENIGNMLSETDLSNIFILDLSPQTRATGKQTELHQTKKSCTVKETVNKTKRQLPE